MKQKKEEGVITLEACVTVLLFLMLMLMLSSLFKLFMAQNATAHVLLQTSQSLSLDTYSAEKIGNGGLGSVGEFIGGIFGALNDDNFTEYENCYSETNVNGVTSLSINTDAVKKRFVAYLNGGDDNKADEFLKSVKVVNGINGLDFSKSYVENDVLYLVLKYELEYDMNFGNLSNIKVEQKVCSKLWK